MLGKFLFYFNFSFSFAQKLISIWTKVCRKNLTINYVNEIISSAFQLTTIEITLIKNCFVTVVTSTQKFAEESLKVFESCLPVTIGEITIESTYSTQLTTLSSITSLAMNKTT